MSQQQSEQHPMSVHLYTTDVLDSIRWYRDVLGFELGGTWPSPEAPQWASLHLAGQTIMLGQAADCPGGPEMQFYNDSIADFRKVAGGGVVVYLRVDDVDAVHAHAKANGGQPACDPKNEFYGLRNFMIADPQGYRLAVYSPLVLQQCQSCAMPLTEPKEGEMYCDHCTDESGRLRPFEDVLEGTIRGFFMGMQKMERAAAEVAARAHLEAQPAWAYGKAKE